MYRRLALRHPGPAASLTHSYVHPDSAPPYFSIIRTRRYLLSPSSGHSTISLSYLDSVPSFCHFRTRQHTISSISGPGAILSLLYPDPHLPISPFLGLGANLSPLIRTRCHSTPLLFRPGATLPIRIRHRFIPLLSEPGATLFLSYQDSAPPSLTVVRNQGHPITLVSELGTGLSLPHPDPASTFCRSLHNPDRAPPSPFPPWTRCHPPPPLLELGRNAK